MGGQFLGKVRAWKNTDPFIAWQDFFQYLESQEVGILFEAFASGENGNVGDVMLFEQPGAASESGYGGNDQDRPAVLQRFTQIGINSQGLGKREVEQAALVFAICLQDTDLVGIACSRGGFTVVVRKVQYESYTPRACADDGNFHASFPYGSGTYSKADGPGM